MAKEHLYTRKIQNKAYYDQNTAKLDIKVDDLVLVKNQTKKGKFDELYTGPHVVLEAHESYVTISRNGKKVKVHKNLIKKAKSQS